MKIIVIILAVLALAIVIYFVIGSNTNERTIDIELQAREFYEIGIDLEKERDYNGALINFQKSLDLKEDEEVRKAYNKVMSALGPM